MLSQLEPPCLSELVPLHIGGYLAPLAAAHLADRGADVAATAAAALGALAGALPWQGDCADYIHFLFLFFI